MKIQTFDKELFEFRELLQKLNQKFQNFEKF